MRRLRVYPSVRRLEDTTAVITGANTGIGKEVARHLYVRGARVVMAVRSVQRGEAAREEIVASAAAGGGPVKQVTRAAPGELIVMQVDLASLQSVRRFAQEVLERVDKVNLLINNASVTAGPRAETEDGFELQLGVNHLGHFLLTLLLLERLIASAPSRIVNRALADYGTMHWEDLMLERSYGERKAHWQSMQARVLFTRELGRRLLGTQLYASAAYPGVVVSDRRSQGCLGCLLQMFNTPEQGVQTTLYCALAPELAMHSGWYYANCKQEMTLRDRRPDKIHRDAARLWELSEQLVGAQLVGKPPQLTSYGGSPPPELRVKLTSQTTAAQIETAAEASTEEQQQQQQSTEEQQQPQQQQQ